jgi:hypothetical protein
MLRLGIVSLPLPVNEAAYGGNSLFGNGWHPPVRMPDSVQDDRDPFWGQCNLELIKKNKLPN